MTQAQERPSTATPATRHHQVVVVGGGNAGISAAARLLRALPGTDVAIIEPSNRHYYQPLWTLVGGGDAKKESTRRSERSVIPKRATWIRDAVTTFLPEENAVTTAAGARITYDYLVVAPGIQLNWSAIPGVPEALGKDGVCSNYSYEYVDKTWEFIRTFKGGTALFTHPATPIKCGGAPQKIAYLADDAFRKNGVRDKTNIIFATANAGIFQVEAYAKTLRAVVERKGIDVRYRTNLVEVRPDTREAVLRNLDTNEETVVHYDLLHVTPPQSAPDFVRNSPLANADGWVDVDKNTLRHTRYANVFSLGDASSLPTSKTGAAIRKQAPVLVKNLVAEIQGRSLDASYDGYTACPLVTGDGKLVMAEFDYDLKPMNSFRIDQTRERRTMYWVKKYGLPRLYWNGIMKGRA
ncbi:MAG: NAD(P)/FAD-dependent oxidoreductase [Dehalococcoidia bacterium]|nr:NAD(P)/FAD-dependent oxidoreductase [Dehalococcoidia bacterium]